jgi:hypothetical protein
MDICSGRQMLCSSSANILFFLIHALDLNLSSKLDENAIGSCYVSMFIFCQRINVSMIDLIS